MGSGFEEIQHTADWALKVWAPDFSALLEQAALGMNHLMGVEIDPNQPVSYDFSRGAGDWESLLVEFLNRILYELEMESTAFEQFVVTTVGDNLHVHLIGGRLLMVQKMIKAATYHNLVIGTRAGNLETTIVFDV